MSLVCDVQAVFGPMCVGGEGLPSVAWMPHCWGLCTRPAPLLPHECGLPCFLLSWGLQGHPEGAATPQPGGRGLTGRTRELVLREGKGA